MRRAGIRVAIALAVLAGVAWAASLVSGFTVSVVLNEDDDAGASPIEPVVGMLVEPLKGLNFDEGDWSAYILLDYYDHRELERDLRRSCLKLTDRAEMKRIQREFKSRYTGADVATVMSRLVFVRNGRVVFSSGIVLHRTDLRGLQTRSWGFLKPEDPAAGLGFAGRFEPVYWPIVVL